MTAEPNEKKYIYCKKCHKETQPVRLIKNDLYYRVWGITIIASFGVALPIFIIFHRFIKKKLFCERCFSRVKFYDSADKIPGTKDQIIRIVNTINLENKEIYCKYCHESIDRSATICPACGSKLDSLILVKE